MTDDLSPETELWLAEHAGNGGPGVVMMRHAIGSDSQDRRDDRRRAQRLAAMEDAAEARAWALRQAGLPVEGSPLAMMRRAAAMGDIADREIEREREVERAELRARNLQLAMDGSGGRTVAEMFAVVSMSMDIEDAAAARAEANARRERRAAAAKQAAEAGWI